MRRSPRRMELTELVDRIDEGEASEEDIGVAPHPREREQVRHVIGGDEGDPARHRGARRQRDDRGLLAAAAALPRRDRLRELGGDAQRPLRAGPSRPRRGWTPSISSSSAAARRRSSPPVCDARSTIRRSARCTHGDSSTSSCARCSSRSLSASDPDGAELLRRRHLTPGWDPETDADYPALIDRIVETGA